jgi:hypothetical protein
MFIDFLEAPRSTAAGLFIYNGGSATLASYAGERGQFTIPPAHRDFLARLQLAYQTDDYFFVHAGVPDIALEKLDLEKHRKYLLWVRTPFHNSKHRWSKLIVHGHSPVREVEIRPTRINVDTGCVYDRTLTALSLPDGKIYSVQRKQTTRIHLRDQSSNRVAVRFKGAVPIEIDLHGEMRRFETLDYSEFGMLMREVRGSHERVLSLGEAVTGTIVPGGHQPVRFTGRVLRTQLTFEGMTYAVQITHLDRPDDNI